MDGWLPSALFFTAIAALAFMVITTVVIEILDLDDRRFRSKRLRHLHQAANAVGYAGMFCSLLIPLGHLGEEALTAAFAAMIAGFTAESFLDIARVRGGFIPEHSADEN